VDADDLLADLDADQRRAVTCESRLVAVIAGAGSGKTRVLTRRVAHRIVTGTADASHTLVLTFTREAAGELRRRLRRLGLTERIEAGTFHSVLLSLIRQRAEDLGRPAPTVVEDRRRLLSGAVGTLGLGSSRTDDLFTELAWATTRGLDARSYGDAARTAGRRPPGGVHVIAELLDAYAGEKRRRGVIDLDDVLLQGTELFTRDPEFAEITRWRFRHVLVDEAQDLSPLQHRVVELLRAGHDDVFLVGDPAQAIYGFNGADPSLLVDVEQRFPGVEVIRLPVNHRCTPAIVDAGVHVLGLGDRPAALRSAREPGGSVSVFACEDEHDEVATVVGLLRSVDRSEIALGQVAVLARTHAQLAPIRAALDAADIPVRRTSDGAPAAHRDAVASAGRCSPTARLRAWAHDTLADLGAVTDPAPSQRATIDVAGAVLDYLREQPTGDGTGFRAWLRTADPFGTRDAGGVELLTFHGAKGREWRRVVIVGAETGSVPHRSATTTSARAEEARLFYVALTRATDHVTVTWAARRAGYQRKRTPLLEGYEPPEPPPVVAPPAVVRRSVTWQADPATRHLRRLRDWRSAAGRRAGVLPEHLLTDDALRRIAEHPPRSAAELADTARLGTITATRLFDEIARALDADDGADSSSVGGGQSSRSRTTGA
jgi:DNA helicase II / ATP-dependent DNA helicase PcrA